MNDTDVNNTQIKQVVLYWQKTAEHDYKTMLSLYKMKHYSDCLFYGHIVLEKILKAHVVQTILKHAPYTHDLVVLHRLAKNLDLDTETINLLDDVNRFNLRTRYPDFKLKFYKLCTPKFTKQYFDKIKALYQQLCLPFKPKN